jgi:hypothetical protein
MSKLKIWSSTEDSQLIKLYNEDKKDICEIAKIHNRSQESIINRLVNLNKPDNIIDDDKNESPLLKIAKSKNPDVDYPQNWMKKWLKEEDDQLLEELNKDTNMETIAQIHKRSVRSVECRREMIIYNLHINNTPIEEIIIKTKLDKEKILEIIEKNKSNVESKTEKKVKDKKQTDKDKIIIDTEIIELKNEIKNLKCEIIELKNTMKEFIEALKQ